MNQPQPIEQRDPTIPSVEMQRGLVCRVGGTSPGITLVNADGTTEEILSISWDEYQTAISSIHDSSPEGPGVSGLRSVLPLFDEENAFELDKASMEPLTRSPGAFLEWLSLSVVEELRERKIPLTSVKAFGFALAGIIDLEEQTCAAANVPLQGFHHYPILSRLPETLQALCSEIRLDEVACLNDGAAATMGEWLSNQGFLTDGTGVAMIHGTGVGGFMIRNGELVGEVQELGYTLVRPKGGGPYEYWPLPKLYELGCFVEREGRLEVHPPKTHYFIEELVGGPWLAIRFVREAVARFGPSSVAELVGISRDAVVKMRDLSDDNSLNWIHHVDKDDIKRINKFIIASKSVSEALKGPLNHFAREHELGAAREMGEGIRALRDHVSTLFPGLDCPVVLVSGMAERRRDDADYIASIREHSSTSEHQVAISRISAAEREAVFLRALLTS